MNTWEYMPFSSYSDFRLPLVTFLPNPLHRLEFHWQNFIIPATLGLLHERFNFRMSLDYRKHHPIRITINPKSEGRNRISKKLERSNCVWPRSLPFQSLIILEVVWCTGTPSESLYIKNLFTVENLILWFYLRCRHAGWVSLNMFFLRST